MANLHNGCVIDTTRKPRPGETTGKDYHFVTQEHFDTLLAQGNYFLETAGFAGNSYGTSVSSVLGVLNQTRVCTLDIELKGVRSLKTALSGGQLEGLSGIFINIVPPSLEELEKRLRGRGTETEESLQKRLAKARQELEMVKEEKIHDWTVVNGADREKAFQELEKIVMVDILNGKI